MSTELEKGADPGTRDAVPESPRDDTPVDKNWLEELGVSSDYARNASLDHVSDINGLVKSYIHGQGMIGRDKTVIPTETDSQDVWDSFYEKVGLPKEEDYEMEVPEDLDDDYASKIAALAHANRILPGQASKFHEGMERLQDEAQDRYESDIKEGVQRNLNGLQKEWGQAYTPRLERAHRAAVHYGGQDFIDYLTETGLGNSVPLIKYFDTVGERMLTEGKLPRSGGVSGGDGFMTPDEAQRKYNDIISDPKHAYRNARHADHLRSVKEVTALMTAIHGTKK